MVDGIKKRKSTGTGTYVAKNAKSSPMHCKINKKLQNSVERKTKVVNYSVRRVVDPEQDPDPYWNRIQELYGSTHVKIVPYKIETKRCKM